MKFVCPLPVVVCAHPQSPPSETKNAPTRFNGNFQLPKLKIKEKGSKTLTLKRASLIEAKHNIYNMFFDATTLPHSSTLSGRVSSSLLSTRFDLIVKLVDNRENQHVGPCQVSRILLLPPHLRKCESRGYPSPTLLGRWYYPWIAVSLATLISHALIIFFDRSGL